jgi:hypothetical protein
MRCEVKKWPVLDDVFPFTCNNPECKKEYNEYEFKYVADHLGYIFITNNKFNFIGLTCPSCFQTTIYKYSKSIPDFFVNRRSNFDFLIPFFARKFQNLQPDYSKDLYHVPMDIIQKYESSRYPDWFEELCIYNIDEKDIIKMLEYENKNKSKVFPRIVRPGTVYIFTDVFLEYLKKQDKLLDNFDEPGSLLDLNGTLSTMLQYNYRGGWAETSITEEEYQDLIIFFMLDPEYPDIFVEKAPSMLFEYLRVRNNLDFEITYKTNFLDKYILEFYHVKGYRKSPQRAIDKAHYEELFGKMFKGPKLIEGSGSLSSQGLLFDVPG